MNNKTLNILKGICMLMSAFIVFIIFIISVVFQIFDDSVQNVIGEFLWATIYFILPIISFGLPIVLTLTLKLNLEKSIITSVVSIFIYAIISLGTLYTVNSYLSDFTQEKWKKYPSERHHMLKDMTDEINFIGMSKENVIEILGEQYYLYADADGADVIDYFVGSFVIDPTMITFVFEDNKVTEVYEYTEFRSSKKPLY